MIKFLDVNSFVKGLTPITATEISTRSGEYHPGGLFSEVIFGHEGSIDRKKTYSYLTLNSKVVHPEAVRILKQLDRKVEEFWSTEKSFILDSDGKLEESEDGVTGLPAFFEMFPKIKFRGDNPTREKYISMLNEAHKTGTIFIDKLPIVPPEHRPAFRDEDGNLTMDELNNVYLSVLRKSFSIRSAAGSGPLYDILNYGVQQSVLDHHKFIQTRVAKKHGLIRQDMMSKRVDFSGRAVITPGPQIKVNEIGLPLRLAAGIFEPFIIHQILFAGRVPKDVLEKELQAFNPDFEVGVDSVKKILKSIKSGDELPKTLYDLFAEATEVAMTGRVVLCKRDPVLHAESVRAYNPVLVHTNTIQMCTMQVGGHNADFDGDAMAIFHPMTNEAQEEAKEKMLKSVSGTSSTAITFEISKEMAVGLYIITKSKKPTNSPLAITQEDLDNATNPYVAVKFKNRTTTMGKALFNSCLPKNYPFFDGQVTKGKANDILVSLVDKYGDEVGREACNRMEKIGFKWATIMAPSMSLDDLQLPDKVYVLKKKLKGSSTEEALEILKQLHAIVKEHLADSGLADLSNSGSTKGWNQPMQMLVAKGIIADPEGNIMPVIDAALADGLEPKEYFNAANGARKGIIDRVLNTATTGYSSRKLAFLLNSVEAHPTLRDCKTKRTVSLKLTRDLMKRMTGRYIIVRGKVAQFDAKDFKPGDVVDLRTPIYCQSPKICLTCYGDLLLRHKTPYIGVL
ncbi:hypothetical protein KAR91_24880, partial [Candidatus Pacearchaeota archaeon]|nr:hypothetical protein [Candidatus Pacearchaeota archaeon]